MWISYDLFVFRSKFEVNVLKSVDEKTPWRTPVFNWCCVDVLFLKVLSIHVDFAVFDGCVLTLAVMNCIACILLMCLSLSNVCVHNLECR